jgi:hypothetical protein
MNRLLNDYSAPHRLKGAVEYREKAITGLTENTSIMFGNRRLDDVALVALHPFNGALLVFSHVTAIAYDVRAQDRGETASAGGYMG